jgi:hypothetical protein
MGEKEEEGKGIAWRCSPRTKKDRTTGNLQVNAAGSVRRLPGGGAAGFVQRGDGAWEAVQQGGELGRRRRGGSALLWGGRRAPEAAAAWPAGALAMADGPRRAGGLGRRGRTGSGLRARPSQIG